MNTRGACFLTILFAVTALSGCPERHPDRDDYVRLWTLATLRAREKGSVVGEELDKILDAEGITVRAFRHAQVEHFDEEAMDAVRRAVRRVLEGPEFLSREEYVRYRARAFLRATKLGLSLDHEIRALGERRGFPPSAFFAAQSVWVGDVETDMLLRRRFADMEGALNVSWSDWREITESPRWGEAGWDAWLLEELENRSISVADWQVMEEAFLITRADYIRFHVMADLRSRIRSTSPDIELARIAENQSFTTRAFEGAARVWHRDDETQGDIRRLTDRLDGALRVPLGLWLAWKDEADDALLESVLMERQVSRSDWAAMNELLGY